MPAAGQTKLTPERRTKFLAALKAGYTRAAAAGLVDVDRSTVTYWCRRFPTFSTECLVAEQMAEFRFASVVIKAAADDPKMALEWLKRRRREEWGDGLTIEVLEKVAKKVAAIPEHDLLTEMGYERDGEPVG